MINKLKQVTFDTFRELKSQDIVLPSSYSKVFQKNALALDLDFDDEEVLLKELEHDNEKINIIVGETNNNLNSLKTSTSEAKIAIEEKDDKKLSKITENLTKLQSKIEFLQKELFSDTLTKALNRRWLEDYYVTDSKMPENGTFVFIDLDKFKNINDTYGHIIGDLVLKYLVSFLNNKLKSRNAKVIRFAGDEFIVIFDENSSKKSNIDLLMSDIKAETETKRLKTTRVSNIQFSFSYGMVNFSKDDLYEDILEKADTLMYKKKKKQSNS